MKFFRLVILAVTTLLITVNCTSTVAQNVVTPYIDPTHLTAAPFGWFSHWLQPWRAYLETIPATNFINGIGVNWNSDRIKNLPLVAEMLSKHGVKVTRVEISWNNIDFDNESQISPQNASALKELLTILQQHQIRPLILLNAHQGAPCPVKFFERKVMANAATGAKEIQLNDVSELQIGYSGLSNLSDYWAAEALITKIEGNTVTLSKPLPKEITAGTNVAMATLKYRPFSVPGSEDYQKSIAGWQKYVETATKFVNETLASANSQDRGFDLEIWNELSFGFHFLNINDYYADRPYQYNQDTIWDNLIEVTANYVAANSSQFPGVGITNGFGNTIPWTASSKQPPQVNGISKHLYSSTPKNYPQDEPTGGIRVNMLRQEDKAGFVPTYRAQFPEYPATVLQTETATRDLAPITTDIYGTNHGRNARMVNGQVLPTPVWITEANIDPSEGDPNISSDRALAIKAKAAARYFCFFLNKGAKQVQLFVAADSDKKYGVLQDNFLEYAAGADVSYPNDDRSYTSPTLMVTSNLVNKMKEKLDSNLTQTRSLEVVSIADTHNGFQFAGNGTAQYPNLYNRDVFTFLPYQVNAKRFVIPYYVMTRDIFKDMTAEEYNVTIKGVKKKGISIAAYDPINNRSVPIKMMKNRQGADTILLSLPTVDYPYLLIIEEA